jgi:beta-glucosidase
MPNPGRSCPLTIRSMEPTYQKTGILLTDILRNDWGFEGIVMSDWFGGQDAAAQVRAGNDLLEPGTKRQWDALIEAYKRGELSAQDIDTSIKRILKLILESRKMQNYQYGNNPDLEVHAKITRQSAAEGMVLLKNENALPFENVKNVALVGVTSYEFIAGGTGSGDVNEAYTVSLEDGLINAGFEINAIAKNIFEKHKEANAEEFVKPEGFAAMFQPYDPPEIVFTKEQLDQIARSSDIAIITIGRNSGEGGDRVEKDDFLLSQIEKDMIQNTCQVFQKVGKKVIVVLNIGGVIETASWKDLPDAILLAWQGGQEGGNAAADIIVGRVNASGKLPMTFPIHLDDHASHANFPLDGVMMSITDMMAGNEEVPEDEKVRNKDYTIYEEGIYVGYRHFDKADLEVSYPFGYGLSYTDFEFTRMNVTLENDTIHVAIVVQNIGEKAGKEVIQIYVAKPNTSIDRPVQELKAFAKTKNLKPGETENVVVHIPVHELSYWNEEASGWKIEKGTYKIRSGASSRDIRLFEEIEI